MTIEHVQLADKPTKIRVSQFNYLKEIRLSALSDLQLFVLDKERWNTGQWIIKYKK